MQGFITKLKGLIKFNPATLKAVAIKWVAILGLVSMLCTAAYFKGSAAKNAEWEAKVAAEKIEQTKERGDNAVDAGKRFGDFKYTQAQLDTAITLAKKAVHEYYEGMDLSPRVVTKTNLVEVPGKPELVYVPIGTCPNDLLGPDELRLFNQGNKRSDWPTLDPDNPK